MARAFIHRRLGGSPIPHHGLTGSRLLLLLLVVVVVVLVLHGHWLVPCVWRWREARLLA